MAIKDFEITFKKIQTSSSKKDVGFVTEFNAISQYIENIAKTQKGELPADKELGSDYFTYIFDGQIYKSEIEVKLAKEGSLNQLKSCYRLLNANWISGP